MLKSIKNISSVLLISCLLSACSSGDGNEIDLFNGISFDLAQGDEIGIISVEDTELYFEILGEIHFQAPLYRKINSGEGIVYLGVPVGLDPLILDNCKSYQENSRSGNLDNWKYCHSTYTFSGLYVSECLSTNGTNTVLMLATHSNQDSLRALYDLDKLISRLKMK